MPYKLFVGGLPWATTSDELEDLFRRYGEVESAKIIADRRTGRSKGYGFVELAEAEAARAALDELNNSEFGGRSITVDPAKDTEL
ncbi:MAG: RNA-binding protein [Planctomycetota bacterium]